jgi:hypothetical protein
MSDAGCFGSLLRGTTQVAILCLALIAGVTESAVAGQNPPTYPAGLLPESIRVVDLNGDGNPDVVVTNFLSIGSLSVLMGNGDGTFQPAATFFLPGENPSYVVAGDFNKDGRPDLAVAGQLCLPSGCNASVTILLGNGDGTFQPGASYSQPSNGFGAASVAVGDFDRDGNPDMAVGVTLCSGTCTGAVAVLMGDGHGAFHWGAIHDSGGGLRASVAVGDLNKDGKLDLVAVNDVGGEVGVLIGNGDGTFQLTATYTTGAHRPEVLGGYSFLVALGKTTAGGDLDLVVANGCAKSITQCNGTVAVLRGNGDATFREARVYPSGGWLSTSVAIGDFNSDGLADVAVSNECSNKHCDHGTVGVLIADRTGTLWEPDRYSSGGWVATSMAVGDLNRDGKLDLVAANLCPSESECSHGTVAVLLGNGDGTFRTNAR